MLSNKVAIVTGAGQGIGLEIAKRLAAAGARVLLNDLETDLAKKAADGIVQGGGLCVPIPGDSSDVSLVQDWVNKSVSDLGQLDMAIANAGITRFGDFFTADNNGIAINDGFCFDELFIFSGNGKMRQFLTIQRGQVFTGI